MFFILCICCFFSVSAFSTFCISTLFKDSFLVFFYIKTNLIFSVFCNKKQKQRKVRTRSVYRPWYLLDGNSEFDAHARKKKGLFGEKIQFVTALDIIKCLKDIKWQRLLHMCAPISELPSNIQVLWYRLRATNQGYLTIWFNIRSCAHTICTLLNFVVVLHILAKPVVNKYLEEIKSAIHFSRCNH